MLCDGAGEREAPGARPDLVDTNRERVARLRSAHLDRPGQRVTGVDSRVVLGEPLARFEEPAGVRRREADGVAGVDRQHRLELAREVTVQGPPLERQLVDHRQNASSLRAASTTRSTDGMYASSIDQYGYGTS